MKRLGVALATIALTVLVVGLGAIPAQAAFGLNGLEMNLTDSGGAAQSQAGSHPFAMTTKLDVNAVGEFPDEGAVKEVIVDLPPGMVANPTAVPTCSEVDFAILDEAGRPECPDNTAVGVIGARGRPFETGPSDFGAVYNLVPPPGAAAALGFHVLGVGVTLTGGVRPDGERQVFAGVINVPQAEPFFGSVLTLWGDPADPAHDPLRGQCLNGAGGSAGKCPVSGPGKAFLTAPTSCVGPLQTKFHAVSWSGPSITFDGFAESPATTGCETLGFQPAISSQPTTTVAESPTGLKFDLDVDDPGLIDPDKEAESTIRKAVVTLPEGITTNSSVASGLGACTLAQYQSEAPDTPTGAGCPESSRVGSVEVLTPLLDEPLGGSIFVARQKDNPFGNLLTIYMVIRNRERGIMIKQAGKVEPNPSTGRLTTTFDGLPQLPFSNFKLSFFSGSRAALTTPATCGSYETTAQLTPWSGGAPVTATSSFTVSSSPSGGPCAASPGQLPNAPGFDAGTLSPLAGAYSPFVLRLTRGDASQQFSSIQTTLPKGLLGKLAGISYCPEAGIAQAAARSGEGQGSIELAQPSCPNASALGIATVGAGSGPTPYNVSGRAYLAGPYKGAPLSLVIITPAIAGPFDLGTVVVRTALNVDLRTAQITAVSDPIPTILFGLPLNVRSIAVEMTRPQFTLNPTSCEPKTILGGVTSTLGLTALLSRYFQVSECGKLKFKPKLSLQLKGSTKRTGHPALKAVLTYPKQGAYANVASAQVGLPRGTFLDQGNIGTVCTQPQLKSKTCPKKSIYGKAKVWSPLLDQPLSGPVYLGVGYGHTLPDLVADLDGQIRVLLNGRIDRTRQGGIRSTFEAVPDAPVSKFVLEMKGGKKSGLLINSENLCGKAQEASSRFVAQNGDLQTTRTPIAIDCGGGKKASRK